MPNVSGLVVGKPKAVFRAVLLPEGLALNEQTGVIEGVPARSCEQVHATVTACNRRGEVRTTLAFTVLKRAPERLAYDAQAGTDPFTLL